MPYKDKAENDRCKREYEAQRKAQDPVEWAKYNVQKSLKYQKLNKEKVRAANKRYKDKNPTNIMVWQARARARVKGIECTLQLGDLVIPLLCPVLGIPLKRAAPGTKKWTDGSPSLDRIDQRKGYTKDNVRIISWRANNLKRDGSAWEFERIAAYIRGEI